MADMAKSATCLPNYLEFIQQSLERATTIRHQCPQSIASIQDGGRGNYEEAEGLVFENR